MKIWWTFTIHIFACMKSTIVFAQHRLLSCFIHCELPNLHISIPVVRHVDIFGYLGWFVVPQCQATFYLFTVNTIVDYISNGLITLWLPTQHFTGAFMSLNLAFWIVAPRLQYNKLNWLTPDLLWGAVDAPQVSNVRSLNLGDFHRIEEGVLRLFFPSADSIHRDGAIRWVH